MNDTLSEKRTTVRWAMNHADIGLSKSRSFFVDKLETLPFRLTDVSKGGFRTLCAVQTRKGERYDFSFKLPFYGDVSGKATVMWRYKSETNVKLSYVGFKFNKFCWKHSSKLKEILSSPKIVEKINEVNASNVNYDHTNVSGHFKTSH